MKQLLYKIINSTLTKSNNITGILNFSVVPIYIILPSFVSLGFILCFPNIFPLKICSDITTVSSTQIFVEKAVVHSIGCCT
jgi:hypothetical protein